MSAGCEHGGQFPHELHQPGPDPVHLHVKDSKNSFGNNSLITVLMVRIVLLPFLLFSIFQFFYNKCHVKINMIMNFHSN